MSKLTFGSDANYDAKYINLCVHGESTFTEKYIREKLEAQNESQRKMVHEMGALMEKSCAPGYSWSAAMLQTVDYNIAVLEALPSLLPTLYKVNESGEYIAETFQLPQGQGQV